MDRVKNDGYFLAKIREDLAFICRHMEKADEEELATNDLLLDSMLFRLIQVSENARKFSNAFREEHSRIPWVALSGLRNRIVHDYGNVDLSIVYQTLKSDIPLLEEMMNGLL